MRVFAVIDTNVIVSALLSRNPEAATVRVFETVLDGGIILLYNEEILNEYTDVLSRPKFGFPAERVFDLLNYIVEEGVLASRIHSDETFPDSKDVVFYEVAISKEDAFLITGNKKHFPHTPIVVTPSEMMDIIGKGE